jgi:hypothetical protein
LHPPVRIPPAEEPRTVDRVDDPDPLGLTEPPELLTEKRVARPRHGERLANQPLDRTIRLGDLRTVILQRNRNPRLEIREGELRRQISGVERKLQVIATVHAPDATSTSADSGKEIPLLDR